MEPLQRAARALGVEGSCLDIAAGNEVEQGARQGGFADAALVGTDQNQGGLHWHCLPNRCDHSLVGKPCGQPLQRNPPGYPQLRERREEEKPQEPTSGPHDDVDSGGPPGVY